jgi:hypothetical protein
MILPRLFTLWEMMKQFDGLRLLNLFAVLKHIETMAANLPVGPVDSDGAVNNAVACFAEAETACKELGLPVAGQKAKTAQDRISSKSLNSYGVGAECNSLTEIIRYELSEYTFMDIEPTKVPFYSNDVLNEWGLVIEKFPSTAFDIEEATKCFALNRYTACVFHLGRIAEIATVTIAKSVEYESWKEGFSDALKYIDDNLKVLRTDRQRAKPAFKGRKQFLSELSIHMHTVIDAWRNQVSHMDSKYTEEEAQRIYSTTRYLMQHLSSELSEVDHS